MLSKDGSSGRDWITVKDSRDRSDNRQSALDASGQRNLPGGIQFRSLFLRYGFAIACLMIALLVRYAATPWVHERNPFTFFIPAVLLAAWYGGWGPGAAALIGGFVLGDYYFTGPIRGLGPYRVAELSLLGVYVLISACGIVLIHLMHRTQVRALESAAQALRYSEQLEEEVAARDLAEQAAREAEQEVRRHADRLESLVAERTATLEESVQSLEGLLYHVAHDLRAPLRAMQGFTTILRTQRSSLSQNEIAEFEERISNAAIRMDRLITDLLHYGRMAQRTPSLAAVNPERCVDVVLSGLAAVIRSTHAEISVERPMPDVVCDRGILIEVMDALLTNALKFVAPGLTPKVRIYCLSTEQRVRLFVADNGIGIPPEYVDRVFRMFERLDPNHPQAGTGIGLAIAAKGVERMKGVIGVDSEVGKGSCFWIDLPRAAKTASLDAA
jgi:signal transduction histidine kinase